MSTALWIKLGFAAILLIWGCLTIPGFLTTPIPIFKRAPGDNVMPIGTAFGVSFLVVGAVIGAAVALHRVAGLAVVNGGALGLAAVYIMCAVGRPHWLLDWMRVYPMFMNMEDTPIQITCGGLAVVFLLLGAFLHVQLG